MKGHTILVIIYALVFGAFLYILIKHETSSGDIAEDVSESEFNDIPPDYDTIGYADSLYGLHA